MSSSTISSTQTSDPVSGAHELLDLISAQRSLNAKLEEEKLLLSTKNLSLRSRLTDAKRTITQLEEEFRICSTKLLTATEKRDAAYSALAAAEEENKLLAEAAADLRSHNAALQDRLQDLQRTLLDHHGLVAEDSFQVADIADRLQIMPHRRTPHTNPDHLTTVFTPKIPMTPVRAFEKSAYVAVGETRTVAIMSPAFVSVSSECARLECDVVINDAFVPIHAPDNPLTLMYLGFCYPDGTSLPYIPVRDVIVQYRANIGKAQRLTKNDRSWHVTYAHDYVYLSMPRAVYERLVRAARKAFEWRFGQKEKWATEVDFDGDRAWVYAGMKPGAKVQCFVDGDRGERYLVDALRDTTSNLEGDGMLYMRFSFKEEHDSVPTLCFRFHKLIMEKTINPTSRFGLRKLLPCSGKDCQDVNAEVCPGLLSVDQAVSPTPKGGLRRLLTCSAGGTEDNTSDKGSA